MGQIVLHRLLHPEAMSLRSSEPAGFFHALESAVWLRRNFHGGESLL